MTKIACVTMMKDEDFFLPIWFRYYARQFGAENLFILDNGSARPPREMLPPELGRGCVNVFRLPLREDTSQARQAVHFDRQRFIAINGIIAGLFGYYDVVLFNDTDEIFVADPAIHADLEAYIRARAADGRIVAGIGLDLFHDRANESSLDLGAPIFKQRRNVVLNPLYAKPHLLGHAATMSPHAVTEPFVFDPELYLVHMKFIDAGRFLTRQQRRRDTDAQPGAWDSWKWDDTIAEGQLAKMEQRMPAGEPLSGDAVARQMFGRTGAVTIGGGDGPERLRLRAPKKKRVLDHVSKQTEHEMRQNRHVLPESFATCGI
ncbi:glycosyltransferase family 2 protein [Mangrovicoccus algicola]|uniref:Glycosyltransferase family 2 protein n=1 Tax=Mangrovicoccus algicola TaxID=2771008 RepID=A0A8J6YY12_9RHOB|nr:glycosyltransferase family 2 protein [Mangrovicoccus algicola]MBE3638629.1 glycosyltransferase family 2 protein [Mangrovicoccus algicola]